MGMALEFAPPLIFRKEDVDTVIPLIDECISAEETALGL